jgi:putative ABC transport system permease protein
LDVTTLMQDLRFGVRMMAKTPVVSAVAILSLALGIAANASMFALANAFLFEPFPYADQERLVLFRSLRAGEPLDLAGGVSVPNFREYVAASDAIEGAALYTTEFLNLTGLDIPEQLSVVAATPTLFDVLGVEPLLGRGFRPADAVEGNARVVVLHHDYWQARFLGDREVLGRSVTLGGEPHTIVGVMPPDFDLIPANIQALRPTDFEQERDNRADRGYMAFARLGTGATVEQLQREIDPVAERQATEFPEANRGMQVMAQPLRSFFPGPTDRRLVQLLTAVTLFGLLIACVNVANLLLSRAEQRQTEVAVRTALGAPRGRILAQLLTESVAMGVVAGAIGLALAVWIVAWLRSALPAELPTSVFPELDPEVLLATLAISVLTGAVFGLAPALHSVGGNLRDSLGSGGRGSTAGRRRRRLRNVFVIGEVAVALALLTGAGFMIQAFDQLVRADPGFDPGGLLTFRVTVLEDRYPEDADVAAYQRELMRALEAIPAVEGVALMSSLPRGFENPQRRYTVDGRPLPEPSELRTAGLQAVNPDYFATMRVPIVKTPSGLRSSAGASRRGSSRTRTRWRGASRWRASPDASSGWWRTSSRSAWSWRADPASKSICRSLSFPSATRASRYGRRATPPRWRATCAWRSGRCNRTSPWRRSGRLRRTRLKRWRGPGRSRPSSWSSGGSLSRWPPWVSTGSWPTPWRSNSERSASGSRSGRGGRGSWAWWPARASPW